MPPFAATRLALVYSAYFTTAGILLPYWPLWLTDRGLGAEEIGVLLAVSAYVKIIANPLAAQIADWRGERQGLMVVLSLLAFASSLFFLVGDGFWPLLLIATVFFAGFSPVMPLGESLTMLNVKAHRLDYGRIRLWGSVTFIAASVGLGHWLVGRSSEWVIWLMIVSVAALVVTCMLAPKTKAPVSDGRRLALIPLLRNRPFVLFMIATGLIQSSHAVYYGFGTLYWLQTGLTEDVIGSLWAVGVIAEIILFIFGQRLVARYGAVGLITLAGLAGLIRWTAVPFVGDALWILVPLQCLHALTFGAAHLGAVHFIAETVPPGQSASAQSLYAAVVMGAFLGTVISFSGIAFDAWSGFAYLPMAAIAVTGALIVRFATPVSGPSDRIP